MLLRFFRWFRRREPPEQIRPRTTSSQSLLLPQDNTANPPSIHHDESRESHVTQSPSTAPAQPSSSGDSGNSKWWSFLFSPFKACFRRSRKINVDRVDEPRGPDTEPAQSSTSDPKASSSQGHIINPQSTVNNTTSVAGTSTQARLKIEDFLPADIPSSQTPTPESPSHPAGGEKEKVIDTIKGLLRTAARTLKIVNLDEIPNTFLGWIETYQVCESPPVAIDDDLSCSLTFTLIYICRRLSKTMGSSKICST